MASDSECWGIELGSGAIKALKLGVTSSGEVEVLDFVVIPHKKVLSTPDLDPDDAMRVAVGQLASQYDLSGAPIAVSVPGNQSFARFAKLPPVEPKQVAGVVKFEAGQQIPFDLDEVEWDYQTFVSPDSPEVEVGIFAITKQRIDRELRLLRDVGLNPDTVTVAPVAAYNAMAYDLQFTEDTPGTVIMDVGTNSTDLIVADKGRVWIRTIPIGGHHFTEALVEKFNLSYAKAERLKREAERSKHSRHVFQAMKGVFADLAQETQQSVGYHKSLHADSDLKRVIGVGSTFKLPGLRRFLKQQLQMDVYRMDEFKRSTLDGPRAGEFGAVSVEMSVAYGLALQGLGMQTIDANLMPVTLVREGVWQKKTKWFATAAALGLVASGAMFIRWTIDNAEVQGSRAPDIINTATRTASTLQSEADEAGVLGATTIDPAVQELLQLPKGREVYGYVVADLADLLQTANAASSDGSGLEMVEFQTTYVPSGSAGGGDDDFGGGRDGGRGGRGRFAGSTQVKPDPYPNHAKIEITLDVRVSEPRPADFLIASVKPWLTANEDRADVPFVIIAEDELDFASLSEGGRGGFPDPRNRQRPVDPRTDDGSAGIDPSTFNEGGGERRDRGRAPAGGPGFRAVGGLPAIPRPQANAGEQTSTYRVSYRLALVPPSERQGAAGESTDEGGDE